MNIEKFYSDNRKNIKRRLCAGIIEKIHEASEQVKDGYLDEAVEFLNEAIGLLIKEVYYIGMVEHKERTKDK